MKSKLNLIALSLLLATSTLSSASFASSDIVEENKPSYSRVIAKKLSYTVLESLAVGATVGAITHSVNSMEDTDAECNRAKILLAGSALINVPGSLPSDWTSLEFLKSVTKIGIKTAFTAGGTYLGASYYQSIQALNGEVEPDEYQRTMYTSYGAALGNLTGNAVITTLDLTGSAFSWGAKKLFGGLFGGKKDQTAEVDTAHEEEESRKETLRLEQVAREEEEARENLRLEQVAREEEEARQREEDNRRSEEALLHAFGENLDVLETTTDETLELQRLAAEERARELNRKQIFWNGVLEVTEEEGKQRAEALKTTKKDAYLIKSDANNASSSSTGE